jgi:cell wall-associated NlpC family hydrolase
MISESMPRAYFLRVLITGLAAATLSSACASTGAVPRPFPMPARAGTPQDGRQTASSPAPADSREPDWHALVGTALGLRGVRYRNGGADPQGFDCSGFTQYVFARHGVALPREVREQYGIGQEVREHLAPGDLLFFTTVEPGASHVAISVGGDEFVHAPSSKGVVRVEHLSAGYWARRYLGARRITPP